jgi:hypothetical protein
MAYERLPKQPPGFMIVSGDACPRDRKQEGDAEASAVAGLAWRLSRDVVPCHWLPHFEFQHYRPNPHERAVHEYTLTICWLYGGVSFYLEEEMERDANEHDHTEGHRTTH